MHVHDELCVIDWPMCCGQMMRDIIKNNTAQFSRPQQVVALIQLNAQLQMRLAALKDPRGLEELVQKSQEVGAIIASLR